MIKEAVEEILDDYLHGSCQKWVMNNYKRGDIIVVIQEYDYEIDCICMAHCLLYRNGYYYDARGKLNDMEEVLEEFDCDDSDIIEFNNINDFIIYLKEMDIF
jgi:hypothetical protein